MQKHSVEYFNQVVKTELPAAHFCDVRVKNLDEKVCDVTMTHQHANQNPFGSIYFAALAMAAELSTGAMVIRAVENAPEVISMLVLNQNAHFSKKARGTITFTCTQGHFINAAIEETLRTREGVTLWLQSVGTDEAGDVVTTMNFEWTMKVKNA
ncbi:MULTISPECIES: DUF4442 domain-containing protein [Vitreoscilla]|uniref:DUF4442 domain-containing protein n=1 Tax=Vitreoscilla stercoraria TaxID=61 RepID=A0ABY4EB34_VITST|nr:MULTISPECIES: DUF4442 domain-containing protein [Vitreoscilla]AUZ06188.2 hypothetical protein ADP71_29840 [Vitreoscilla sp. C1]UOO92449.1 DUF4442 domain-containing protein [Vitreoscilla stercoraria]